MNKVAASINERIAELEQVIANAERKLKQAPEGSLNIYKIKGHTYYYHKIKLPQNQEVPNAPLFRRKYIKKSELKLAEKLCQKEYNQQVLQVAYQELSYLQQMKKICKISSCEEIYTKLPEARRRFVSPIYVPDDEYIKNWSQEEYERKMFDVDAPEYYTDRGERVRSKSEILIANALYKHNIPYHYEKPLYLKGYGRVYPDFTILNIRERKEYYYEHFGMMDDPDYAEKAILKIETYQKNGIFPGINLLMSFESSRHPINSKIIEKTIYNYLK